MRKHGARNASERVEKSCVQKIIDGSLTKGNGYLWRL